MFVCLFVCLFVGWFVCWLCLCVCQVSELLSCGHYRGIDVCCLGSVVSGRLSVLTFVGRGSVRPSVFESVRLCALLYVVVVCSSVSASVVSLRWSLGRPVVV